MNPWQPEPLLLHCWPAPILASRRRRQLAFQTGHTAAPVGPYATIAGAAVPGGAAIAERGACGASWRPGRG